MVEEACQFAKAYCAPQGIPNGTPSRFFTPDVSFVIGGILIHGLVVAVWQLPSNQMEAAASNLGKIVYVIGKGTAECALCGPRLPVDLLWIGHIKKATLMFLYREIGYQQCHDCMCPTARPPI